MTFEMSLIVALLALAYNNKSITFFFEQIDSSFTIDSVTSQPQATKDLD
jgi:hypothetical protein